jgi:sRNA-binding carbon storage regulator CsrA
MSGVGNLTVTRREGHSIDVHLGGRTARVTIKKARHGKAVIGIEAPLEIEIRRVEDRRSAEDLVGRRIET